jgi:hypothetical protein
MKGMKLSEIRPCDACGGTIVPMFYVLRLSMAMFKPQAVNTTMGLMQMFGGNLALAEVMSSQPDAVTVMGDENPELMTEIIICQECLLGKPLDMALLLDKVQTNEKKDSA